MRLYARRKYADGVCFDTRAIEASLHALDEGRTTPAEGVQDFLTWSQIETPDQPSDEMIRKT
jgi:hypothetical protein